MSVHSGQLTPQELFLFGCFHVNRPNRKPTDGKGGEVPPPVSVSEDLLAHSPPLYLSSAQGLAPGAELSSSGRDPPATSPETFALQLFTGSLPTAG